MTWTPVLAGGAHSGGNEHSIGIAQSSGRAAAQLLGLRNTCRPATECLLLFPHLEATSPAFESTAIKHMSHGMHTEGLHGKVGNKAAIVRAAGIQKMGAMVLIFT